MRVCPLGGGRRPRHHAAADACQAAQKRHGPGIAVAHCPAFHQRTPGRMRRGGSEVIGHGAAQQVMEIPFPGEFIPTRPGGQAACQMHQFALTGRIHAVLRHNGHGLLRLIRRIADAVRANAQGAQLRAVQPHRLHGSPGVVIACTLGQLDAFHAPKHHMIDQVEQLLLGSGQHGIVQHGIRRVGRGGLRQAGRGKAQHQKDQRRHPPHETAPFPANQYIRRAKGLSMLFKR